MIEGVLEEPAAEVPDGVVFGIRREEGGEELEGGGRVVGGFDGGEDAGLELFVFGYGLFLLGECCC